MRDTRFDMSCHMLYFYLNIFLLSGEIGIFFFFHLGNLLSGHCLFLIFLTTSKHANTRATTFCECTSSSCSHFLWICFISVGVKLLMHENLLFEKQFQQVGTISSTINTVTQFTAALYDTIWMSIWVVTEFGLIVCGSLVVRTHLIILTLQVWAQFASGHASSIKQFPFSLIYNKKNIYFCLFFV